MQKPEEMLPWIISEMEPQRYVMDLDFLRSRMFGFKVLFLITGETS